MRYFILGVLILLLASIVVMADSVVKEYESNSEHPDRFDSVLGSFFVHHKGAFREQDKQGMMQSCGEPEVLAKKMLEKLKATANNDLTQICRVEPQEECLIQVKKECEIHPQLRVDERTQRPFVQDCPPDKDQLLRRCLQENQEANPKSFCEGEWQRKCAVPVFPETSVERSSASVDRTSASAERAYASSVGVSSVQSPISAQTSASLVTASVIYQSPSNKLLQSYRRGEGNGLVGHAVKEMPIVPLPAKPMVVMDAVDQPAREVSTYPVSVSQSAVAAAQSSVAISSAVQEFRSRGASWACYDGVTSTEDTCRSSGEWQKIAQNYCAGHCYADGSKCGVNSFSAGGYCEVVECGNGVCEEGEDSYCPPCVNSNPPCMAPCRVGSCPQDCKVNHCPVDTPMPPCSAQVLKKVDEQGCLHYYCQSPSTCPTISIRGCQPGEREVPNGLDKMGCQLPSVCMSSNTVCPEATMPICPQGALNKELDTRGCPSYSCRESTVACGLPSCPGVYFTGKYSPEGCQIYECPKEDYCKDKDRFLEMCKNHGSEGEGKNTCYARVDHEYGRRKEECDRHLGGFKDSCFERMQERCTHRLSKEDCLKFVTEDNLYQELLRKAQQFCQNTKNVPVEAQMKQLATQDVEHAEILKEKSQELVQVKEDVSAMQQTEDDKGLGYKFKSLFGLMKDQELSEAQRIRDNIHKLDETIKVLNQVSQSSNDPLVQAVLADQITSLREQQAQLEKLAEEKEKRAKGLFGLFG